MISDGAAGHALPIMTALELPGARVVQRRGTCFGLVVRSTGLAKGVSAALSTLRQGEVSRTELLEDSRRHAIDRMVDHARLLSANASGGGWPASVAVQGALSPRPGRAARRRRRGSRREWMRRSPRGHVLRDR